MLTFKDMRLEVYRRANGEGMVALLAENPTVGTEADEADRLAWDEGRYGCNTAGIRYLSFYFTHEEFTGLLTGKLSGCNDCSHNVRAFGELLTFYDLEFSRETRGRVTVPFVNLHIPHYVGKFLVRAVQHTLAKCVPDGDRITFSIPWATRERWMRLYGQGTGSVVLDVVDGYPKIDAVRDFYAECEQKGGETFARCVENLKAIGLNSTYRHTDTATVKLSKDLDGWYFRILRPDGRCTLNGGVVNHGRDGKHDWSTHT